MKRINLFFIQVIEVTWLKRECQKCSFERYESCNTSGRINGYIYIGEQFIMHMCRRRQLIIESRITQTLWNEWNTLFKNEMLTMWVDSLEQVLDAGLFLHPSMAASGDGIDTLNFWLSHWICISGRSTSDNQMKARYSASHMVVSK